MRTYLIKRKENVVVYSIPAKTRLLFVVSYSIWAAIFFAFIAFLLFGSIVIGVHGSGFGDVLGIFIFSLVIIYLLNSITYWLKGEEVLEIDSNGMVRFHRYGLYRFQKEEFHLDKLKSVSFKSEEYKIVDEFRNHEEGDAKIVIAFWNKVGSNWGNEVTKIEFGASLNKDSANEVLSAILNDFGIAKNHN